MPFRVCFLIPILVAKIRSPTASGLCRGKLRRRIIWVLVCTNCSRLSRRLVCVWHLSPKSDAHFLGFTSAGLESFKTMSRSFARITQFRHFHSLYFSRPNRFTELSWRKAKTLERVARQGWPGSTIRYLSLECPHVIVVVYRNHCAV